MITVKEAWVMLLWMYFVGFVPTRVHLRRFVSDVSAMRVALELLESEKGRGTSRVTTQTVGA